MNQERLKEFLKYDPETGIFRWRSRPINHRVDVGDVAGYSGERGVQIRIDGVLHLAHRLAWLYMTGSFPKLHIDHKNGDPQDNRWKNLRDVSRSVNLQNQRHARKNNTTGMLGVARNRNRFKAVIVVKGAPINLGTFKTPEEAHEVYLEAKRKFHQGCTI